MVTEDHGEADPVWSEPRRLFEGTMLNKPAVLTSGEWLFPVNLKKHLSEFRGGWTAETASSIAVLSTNDQGRSFRLRGSPAILDSADFAGTSEPMIIERADGTLWMLIRMRYGLGETLSRDGGNSWSIITPAAIKHTVSRFFIRRLNSGNLLLVKHGPINERTRREQLTAFISKDDGATWKGGLMLDERHPVSYPDGIQAPDSRIYVVYDHGRYPGTAREILMAVFTEADVLRGEPSEKTRLRVLISRAIEPACDQKIR
jgi:hypothetical protein